MKVLILEDGELIADFLETFVSSLYPRADWKFPAGSGPGLFKAIRCVSQSTPVMMISGRGEYGTE